EELPEELGPGLGEHPGHVLPRPRDVGRSRPGGDRGVPGHRLRQAPEGLGSVDGLRATPMRDRRTRWARGLVATCALGLLSGSARADRVLTTDGRILAPKKARVEGAGYRLTFENGTIVLPDKSLVASAEIEGDMADYVPANDDEREKLA